MVFCFLLERARMLPHQPASHNEGVAQVSPYSSLVRLEKQKEAIQQSCAINKAVL